MFGIIIIIISITLLAILLFAGSNHINFSGVSLIKDRAKIESSFISLDNGITKYHIINGSYPSHINELIPSYTIKLNFPSYLSLDSVARDGSIGAVRVCVSGLVDKEKINMIKDISKNYSTEDFYVSYSCGGANEINQVSYPFTAVINYIIK